jgi:hypothetical protein
MTDVDGDEKKRERSPNYPFLSLPMALGRVQQMYAEEKRASIPPSVLARHWGYSPKSSGLVQSIAALKSYGLIEDDGRGADRRVRLTERALRIILDERPDSTEKAEYIRQAADSPPLMARLREAYPDELPSQAALHHFLIFDLKFGPEAAKAALRIITENQDFIRAFGPYSISGTIQPVEEPTKSVAPTIFPPPRMGATSEKIIGPDGDIVLQFAQEPSWDSYDFLENYIKLRKSVLKRSGKNKDSEET